MATGKTYWWIKLKKDFLTGNAIDFLMGEKDGASYVVLYLILCINCINTGGVLANSIGEMIIPFNIDKIQRDCKYFSKDTIIVALELFKKIGMIYEQKDGMLAIPDFEDFVGYETDYASQKRVQRKSKQEVMRVDSNVDLTVDNVHTEIDIEKEIDIDIDKEKEKEKEKNTLVDSAKSTCEKEEKYCEELTLLQKERTNFEIIYKEYPKKAGKAKAFDYYRQWIKGRKMSTGTQKLENIQIYRAVKKYVGQMEEKNTEIQYYKNFDTFMNKAILDYLEE